MKTWVFEASPRALALLFFLPAVQGLCPGACSCSGSDRSVDCSGRNLTALPGGLQENITHLNLSYNRLTDLNFQLTPFANLRTLDLSHNRLPNLPAQLPKSLWEIYASHNRIKVLQKLDTAYQWNLKVLDVSDNVVERAVLINNTLSRLQVLNLSRNKLWTVPTNIPSNTESVDLSDNFLTQILPGTLSRLSRLSKLYLHNNKFTYIPDGAFDRLAQLRLITLYNNPWACEEEEEDGGEQALSYLQEWVGETAAAVLGQPCSDESVTLGKEAPLDPAAPTAAENPPFVKAMKAAVRTAEPPGTTGQSQHVRHGLGTEDARSGMTAGQTIAFTSTDRPLVLYPEELSTGKLSSYEAGPAPHTVYVHEATSGKSGARGRVGSLPTTPLTLSISSGVPTNYSRRPPSTTTTTTAKKEEATTKISPRAPSQANLHKGDLYLIATLAAVALATGYGLVLK